MLQFPPQRSSVETELDLPDIVTLSLRTALTSGHARHGDGGVDQLERFKELRLKATEAGAQSGE